MPRSLHILERALYIAVLQLLGEDVLSSLSVANTCAVSICVAMGLSRHGTVV